MELRTPAVSTTNYSGELASMRGRRKCIFTHGRGIAMDEVRLSTRVDAIQQRIVAKRLQCIPSHVWNPDAVATRQLAHGAGEQTEAWRIAFFRCFEQQLHPET